MEKKERLEKCIYVRLKEGQRDKLKALSNYSNMSMSNLIRLVIEKEIAKYEEKGVI